MSFVKNVNIFSCLFSLNLHSCSILIIKCYYLASPKQKKKKIESKCLIAHSVSNDLQNHMVWISACFNHLARSEIKLQMSLLYHCFTQQLYLYFIICQLNESESILVTFDLHILSTTGSHWGKRCPFQSIDEKKNNYSNCSPNLAMDNDVALQLLLLLWRKSPERQESECVCEGLSNISELRRKELSEYGQHIPLATVPDCMEGIKHAHQHSALSSSWLQVNCIQLSQTSAMVTSLPGWTDPMNCEPKYAFLP